MLWYWVFLTVLVLGAAAASSFGVLRFHDAHPKVVWVIAALVVFNASWMGFDGARALVVGDYVTPQGSGRLGPWSGLVSALGVDPRSGIMKTTFVFYGVSSLGVALAFLMKVSWGWRGMVIIAALGLWYLPFGTVLGSLTLVLLLLPQVRKSWSRADSYNR